MVRIQNMEAYWNDIRKIASNLEEYNEEVSDNLHQLAVKSLASFAVYLDVQRILYNVSDKEMDDAIRSELYRHMKSINERSFHDKKDMDENLRKAFSAAHECCGGCVD